MKSLITLGLKWGWQNTRSWKTTAVAAAQVLTGLALMAGYIASNDSNPDEATVQGATEILAWLMLVSGAGSWMSRDANVSSGMTKI